MEEKHKQLLNINSLYLCKHLDVSPLLFASLQSNGVLTDCEVDEIEVLPGRQQKVRKLIKVLKTKSGMAFKFFMDALAEPENCSGYIKKYIENSQLSNDEPEDVDSASVGAVQPTPPNQVQTAISRLERRNTPSTLTSGPSSVLSTNCVEIPQGSGSPTLRRRSQSDTDLIGRFEDLQVDNWTIGENEPKTVSRQESEMDNSPSHYEIYPRNLPKRVIIINMEMKGIYHEGVDKQRYGSEKDVEKLSALFENVIPDCDIQVKNDCSPLPFKMDKRITEIKAFLEVEASNGGDYSGLILFAMSHGNSRDQIYLTLNQVLNIDEDIIGPFSANRSSSYIKKPKMFFILACRGGIMATPVSSTDDWSKNNHPTTHALADILKVTSCTDFNPSFRDEIEGSSFISSLIGVFENKYRVAHVLEMVTEVQFRMNALEPETVNINGSLEECKQLPVMRSTLLRKVYLN